MPRRPPENIIQNFVKFGAEYTTRTAWKRERDRQIAEAAIHSMRSNGRCAAVEIISDYNRTSDIPNGDLGTGCM